MDTKPITVFETVAFNRSATSPPFILSQVDRPERVAIYASGGLSHYPGMYNSGRIDQPLDHWILERLQRNDHEALKHLFTFDSNNVRAGTGEVRAWISVAAAMERPAKFVE